jgi:hypothetical protein
MSMRFSHGTTQSAPCSMPPPQAALEHAVERHDREERLGRMVSTM